MASTSTTPTPVKQLGELLQQQQEPFILEIYLLERGYPIKTLDSKGNFSHCHHNSSKSLNRSGHSGLNKSKKSVPRCSKLLRAIYNKFIFINERLRTKNYDTRDGEKHVTEISKDKQEVAESDRFSSASSTTVFNSCSESDIEEISTSLHKKCTTFTANSLKICNPKGKEAAADRKFQWRCIKKCMQPCPMPVLDEVPSLGGSTFHYNDDNKNAQQYFSVGQEMNPSKNLVIFRKKVTEDSILSASLWKLLFHSETGKQDFADITRLEELVQSNPFSQYVKSKRVLQQTRQLLFDCVKEDIENHNRNEKSQQYYRGYLRSEGTGELICENMKAWDKQFKDASTLTELFNLDILNSAQEWSDFEPQQREIGLQIGDAILEEIRNEIVMEMINFLAPDRS